MAADDLSGWHEPESVERLRHFAHSVIDVGSGARDD